MQIAERRSAGRLMVIDVDDRTGVTRSRRRQLAVRQGWTGIGLDEERGGQGGHRPRRRGHHEYPGANGVGICSTGALM